MSDFHPELQPGANDPFASLTDEERVARIEAATVKLADMELQDILAGDVVPSNLPQPDYSALPPALFDEFVCRLEDWEI